LGDFADDVVGRARAPGVPGNSLGPHAESAEGGAAARGVERDVRVQEERNVVALDLQIAFVDIGGKGKRIEFRGMQLWLRGIVNNAAILAVTGAKNLIEGLAVSIIRHGVIKFAARDEVNVFAGIQSFIGLDMAMRADE